MVKTSLREWKAGDITSCEFNIWIKRVKPVDAKIFRDIRTQEKILKKASEDDLAFYWRIRNDLQNSKADRYKIRSLIWEEMERRYEGGSENQGMRFSQRFVRYEQTLF